MVTSGYLQNLLRVKSKQLGTILRSEVIFIFEHISIAYFAQTLLAGLIWHQSNVRLAAIKLLMLVDDNPYLLCCLDNKMGNFNLHTTKLLTRFSAFVDLKVELSSFVLNNCDTECDDLFQLMITLLPKIKWTEGF